MRIYAKWSALLVAVLFLGYSFTTGNIHGSATQAGSPKEDAKKIAALYDRNCARCHGADGRGETLMGGRLGVPNFADRQWKKTASEKRLIAVVANGHEAMPAFKNMFTKEEIKALVVRVRNFQK